MVLTLGAKIRLLRETKGMKQNELAEILGVTLTTMSHYECDVNDPTVVSLKKMADHFCIHVGYFYANIPPHQYFRVQEDLELAIYLSVLPIDLRNSIRVMIKSAHDDLILREHSAQNNSNEVALKPGHRELPKTYFKFIEKHGTLDKHQRITDSLN